GRRTGALLVLVAEPGGRAADLGRWGEHVGGTNGAGAATSFSHVANTSGGSADGARGLQSAHARRRAALGARPGAGGSAAVPRDAVAARTRAVGVLVERPGRVAAGQAVVDVERRRAARIDGLHHGTTVGDHEVRVVGRSGDGVVLGYDGPTVDG